MTTDDALQRAVHAVRTEYEVPAEVPDDVVEDMMVTRQWALALAVRDTREAIRDGLPRWLRFLVKR